MCCVTHSVLARKIRAACFGAKPGGSIVAVMGMAHCAGVAKLLRETSARVVLCSTWRLHAESRDKIEKMLHDEGAANGVETYFAAIEHIGNVKVERGINTPNILWELDLGR